MKIILLYITHTIGLCLCQSIDTMSNLPALIVFDLDYTLWPFWVDTHVTPPFRKNNLGQVIDSQGCKILIYKEVPAILELLKSKNIKIGVASRTSEIDGANQLLHLFDWNKYISYKEIYPGSKDTHFNRIKKKSGIKFSEMIFFDDEYRNIRDLERLGVLSILVQNGMNMDLLNQGLKLFEGKRSKSSKS